MKKRMFLTTVLMTLVLLLAVTTATFAWYQASAGAGKTFAPADTTTVSTVEKEYQAGSFQIEVVFDEFNGAPSLTNELGKTYYYAGDASGTPILDNAANTPYSTGSFKIVVTYTGASTTAADIAALWATLEATLDLEVVISDDTEHAGNPVAGASLKFWTEAPTNWTTAEQDGEEAISISVDLGALTFSSAGEGQPFKATWGTTTSFYYGAVGVAGAVQKSTDKYQMMAAVQDVVNA